MIETFMDRLESYGDRRAAKFTDEDDYWTYREILNALEYWLYKDPIDFYVYSNSINIFQWILYALTTKKTTLLPVDAIKDKVSTANFKEPGIVIETSGTTGEKKYAYHDLEKFMQRYTKERPAFTTLLAMNPTSMGGIDVALTTFLSGGLLIIPGPITHPDAVLDMIDKYKIELLPASPSLLRLLLFLDLDKYDLSSLKIIAYGSEVMPETTLNILKEKFPNVKFIQTFGMTELGTIKTKTSPDGTWVKLVGDDIETKVVDNILYIKSSTSMVGYLNYPNPFTDDGFLNTGDRVEVNGEYIKFLGRESSIINVGGRKVDPVEVENVIINAPHVIDVLVRGEDNPILGQIVVADVILKEYDNITYVADFNKYCEERLPKYKRPVKFYLVDKIDYTDTGKKRRI